jgi:zinc transport system substrate-binding protein
MIGRTYGSRTLGVAILPAILLGIWLAVLIGGVGSAESSEAAEQPLSVFVSIGPQAYFVDRLGGEHVQTSVLVKPGQSPATYEPTARQMTSLADADVYFRIGVPFEEPLLNKFHSTLEHLHVVDTRQGIPLRAMDEAGDLKDEHGRGAKDPHIWLAPRLAAVQAETIANELIRLDSSHAEEYRANLKAFQGDLENLDRRLDSLFAPFKGQRFYIFHASYGYFADAYGLVEVPIEIGGKEPGSRQLAGIIEQAKADGVRTVLVQKEFSSTAARALAEAIGGVVVPVDPLAYDYPRSLWNTARQIADALSQQELSNRPGNRSIKKVVEP